MAVARKKPSGPLNNRTSHFIMIAILVIIVISIITFFGNLNSPTELTYSEFIDELESGNVILEPVARNTAPACFLGSLVAEEDEVVFILPADHYIPNKEKFWEVVERGIKAA